jgi:signal transduction histidine kinase
MKSRPQWRNKINLLSLALLLIAASFLVVTLQNTRDKIGQVNESYFLMVILPAASGFLFVLLGTLLFFALSSRRCLIPLLFFHFWVGNFFIFWPEMQLTHVSYPFLVCSALIPATLIHFSLLISEMWIESRKALIFYWVPYLISLSILIPDLYFFKKDPSLWVRLNDLLLFYTLLASLFFIFRLLLNLKKPFLELDRALLRSLLIGQILGFLIPLGIFSVMVLRNIPFPIHLLSPVILLFPLSLFIGVIPARREQQENYVVQSEKRQSFGGLLAGLAHELNNPLTFIYSSFEPIRESIDYVKGLVPHPDSKATQVFQGLDQMLKNMEEGVTRAKGLIDTFRFFPQRRVEQKEEIDLNSILDQSIDLLSHQWKGRIRIVRRFEKIPKIRAFPGELAQVFTNILANACEATAPGGIIYVSTHSGATGIKIMIQDTGQGISPENLSRIFDPFFTTKEPGQGTGLGLSISQQIIKSHKGSIEVKSELKKGTEFLIFLPF